MLPSAPMSKWLPVLVLACAGVGAHAAPAAESGDDLGRFMAQRGFIGQIQNAGHQVADKTGQLLSTAMGLIGVPYRRGGTSEETGFDCSGFVRAIYQKTAGLTLPRLSAEQAAATETIKKQDLKPGDLVFFNTMRRAFSHVGIYVGEGKFIHAPRTGASVRVESMESSYWANRFNGARRVDTNNPDLMADLTAPQS